MLTEDMNCAGKDPREWDNETEYAYHQCMGCKARIECLANALADVQSTGTLGGWDEAQRAYMRRGKKPPLRAWQKYRPRNLSQLGRNQLTPSQNRNRENLHAAGKTDQEIAEIEGITRTAVASWRHRNRLEANNKPKMLTEDERQERFLLYRQGLTDMEIANATGASYGAIQIWRKRAGMKPNMQASA